MGEKNNMVSAFDGEQLAMRGALGNPLCVRKRHDTVAGAVYDENRRLDALKRIILQALKFAISFRVPGRRCVIRSNALACSAIISDQATGRPKVFARKPSSAMARRAARTGSRFMRQARQEGNSGEEFDERQARTDFWRRVELAGAARHQHEGAAPIGAPQGELQRCRPARRNSNDNSLRDTERIQQNCAEIRLILWAWTRPQGRSEIARAGNGEDARVTNSERLGKQPALIIAAHAAVQRQDGHAVAR
jgi:hypothetical protein